MIEITTLHWARPWAFLLLVAVPLVVWVMAHNRKRGAVMRVPSALAVISAGKSFTAIFAWLPAALRVGAICLTVIALARPQVRASKSEDVTVEGIDIIITLDVSTSMKAADFKPRNRLHVAKRVIADFIDSRVNDRIGLVVFAGEAYTQAPLTLDYHVLLDVLDAVRMGLIEDGTAIGNALATSLNRLRDSEATSKVVIIVTDGDSNAGNISPTKAAALAKQLGVQVFTIMVGRGGEVPYPAGRDLWGRVTYQKVAIPVNPDLLEEIAEFTGGKFYTATDRKSLEGSFRKILDELEKTKLMEGGTYVRYTEVFPLALLPAVLLIMFEFLLSATRMRRFP